MSQASPPQPTPVTPAPDKNQLLLLGLQLLNKGLRLPCAVVPPNVQAKAPATPAKPKPPPRKVVSSPSVKDAICVSPRPMEEGNSRKRKRNLNEDLSGVEKREKRKMTNRVAAQNARDRRKQYVEELESKIALLESKNQELQKENRTLKQQTDSLSTENKQLEQKLTESDSTHPDLLLHALVKESLLESPAGSAVPLVSPQQKQVPRALLLRALMTSDFLAQLLGFSEELSPPGSCDPTSRITWDSCDLPPAAFKTPAVVGSQSSRVEPTTDLQMTDSLSSDQLGSDADMPLSNIALDSFLELGRLSDELMPDVELEKLLHPFACSIVGPEGDSWDIESLFAV